MINNCRKTFPCILETLNLPKLIPGLELFLNCSVFFLKSLNFRALSLIGELLVWYKVVQDKNHKKMLVFFASGSYEIHSKIILKFSKIILGLGKSLNFDKVWESWFHWGKGSRQNKDFFFFSDWLSYIVIMFETLKWMYFHIIAVFLNESCWWSGLSYSGRRGEFNAWRWWFVWGTTCSRGSTTWRNRTTANPTTERRYSFLTCFSVMLPLASGTDCVQAKN